MDSSCVLQDPSGRSSATATVHIGDCLETLRSLPDESVYTCITSPPYFRLRSYLPDDHPEKTKEIGLEQTPEQFVAALVAVFREVRRVLRDDGTLWLNLGDSYANDGKWGGSSGGKHASALHGATSIGRTKVKTGLKAKDLIGIPWRVAFALQADGWILRQDVIWEKPNPMPESVTDRCTKAHEYLFLLTKSPRYYFDADAFLEDAKTNAEYKHWTEREYDQSMLANKQENGVKGRPVGVAGYSAPGKRNRRSVWTIPTKAYSGAHFATFPQELIEPCVLAGCPEGGTVLDPFGGSGTTAGVSIAHGRNAVICELNPESVELMPARVLAIVCPDARVPESDPDAPQAELFGAEVAA